MKKLLSMLILMGFAISIVSLSGCKKDEDDSIADFNLTSLKCGNLDLDGATSATDVPVDQPIIAVFSTNISEASVEEAVALSRGTNGKPYTYTVDGKTLTINATGGLLSGASYVLDLANTLKSTEGASYAGISVSFLTMGVGIDTPPQKEFQTMYVQFNGGVSDLIGMATTNFEQVSYTTDRFGNANGAASFAGAASAGTGDIIELSGDDLISPSMTISTWFKTNSADYTGSRVMFGLATERGYFMELGGDAIAWMKLATSHKIDPDPNNHYFGTAWTDPNGDGGVGGQVLYDYEGSISDLVVDKWTHLVMTFDASTSVKTIFIDGVKIMQVDLNLDTEEWYLADLGYANKMDGTGDAVDGIDPVLSLGYLCSRANTATSWSNYATAENTYKGELDDFRLFNKALTESEVLTLYNLEK